MTEADLKALLARICRAASAPFHAYVLGGGALVLAGLQEETGDADLIVDGERDLRHLVAACTALGYRAVTEPAGVSRSAAGDKPVMLILGLEVLDVFRRRTTHFALTAGMRSRALVVVSGTATIAAVHPQDVLVLKSATGRATDAAVARRILGAQDVDWDTLLAEVRRQQEVTCRAAHDVLAMCHEGALWAQVPARVLTALGDLARAELDRLVAAAAAHG